MLAEYLLGTWRVERALHDDGLGDGTFTGEATFTREDGGVVRWVETGRLVLGRYDGPAARTLEIVPDGAGLQVRFADGRPFHRLDLHDGHCALDHPCGDDRYRGEFLVRGPDAFAIDWQVSGPAKAQRLSGRYERAARPTSAPR
jgi:hypothetical protein